MSNTVGAILLDTRSIQRYVFGCNDLKTNIGASYLVDAIFEEAMLKVLQEQDFDNLVLDWESRNELLMRKDSSVDCEIAYIGGGNMVILVRTTDDDLAVCKKIVADWSTKLLLEAPGLKTGAAIGMIDLEEDFQASLDALFKKLKEHQNTIFPNVDLPYTGLTLEYDVSGKTADVMYRYYNADGKPEVRMIAAEVKAKIVGAKYAIEKNKEIYKDVLGDEFEFCKDINNIGYKNGESYICVIHIDGNNMGLKFNCCANMEERKELSMNIASAVKTAFKRLVSKIIKDYDGYSDILDMQGLTDSGKKILPIRPIIIGGDDITFVCPGKLGLEYASTFMKEVSRIEISKNSNFMKALRARIGKNASKSMSCCAGVAIVPAKYPFFRAYELAEQLCSSAKALSRESDGFYLDFAILHGEMYADLATLRREQYTSICGNLHYGPYEVVKGKVRSLGKLMRLRDVLLELPSNKQKELRRVLHEDLHSQQIFLEHCEEFCSVFAQLGKNKDANAEQLWEKLDDTNVTKLMDAIEIIDFTY